MNLDSKGKFPIHSSAAALFIAVCLLVVLAKPSRAQTEPVSATAMVRCWERAIPVPLAATPAAADGALVVAGTEGRLIALDDRTGEQLWTLEVGGSVNSNLLPAGKQVYFVTGASVNGAEQAFSTLRTIDIASGVVLRSVRTGGAAANYLGLVDDGVVLVSSTGEIRSYAPSLDRELWGTALGLPLNGSAAISKSAVAMAIGGRAARLVEIGDGETRLERVWNRAITAVAAVNSDALLVGDDRGTIAYFSGNSSKPVWTFKTGGAIGSLSIAGNDPIVVSHDNFIYRLSAASGDVLWRKRLGGRAEFPPMIGSKFIAVAGSGESFVSIIDVESGKQVNRIDLENNESLIASPVKTTNGRLVLATPGRLASYAEGSCAEKQ